MLELEKLFGSQERVKLIRFFIGRPDGMYEVDEISEKTKVKPELIRKEINSLVSSGLVTKSKEKFAKSHGNVKNKKPISVKEYICYRLNKDFRFLKGLEKFVFDFQNANREALFDRFKNLGRTKLFLLSGIFTGTPKSRVDIMYVAEGLKTNMVEKVIGDLRAELGKDVQVSVMDLEEFNYRYKMFDRFVRDTLVGEKEVIVDKLNIV